tara:strand:+ start:2441 stop:3577 length:1137 start_codon:yes stop_codon:yes gene_type:complete
MDDLLKEAIADAKAVRETALENAKMALEEAFTPKLKSMLAQKIQAEIEDEGEDHDVEEEGYGDEDEEMEVSDEEAPAEEPAGEESEEEEVAEIADEDEDAEEVSEIEDEDEDAEVSEIEDEDEDAEEVSEIEDEDDEMEEELDLESILAELEAEIKEEDEEDGDEEKVDENDVSSDIGKADNKVNAKANDSSETGAQGPEGEGKDEPAGKELDDHDVVKEGEAHDEDEEVDEEIDLEEVLKALSEEEDEDETHDEVATLQAEVKEHRDVVKYLREKLNEVNLLNAKLLFSNKLFRAFGLSNEQKLKVVETFDRTKNLREIKLVYSTLAESFRGVKVAPVKVSKGSSSKVVASTKTQKDEVLSEGAELKGRFKKLANIL